MNRYSVSINPAHEAQLQSVISLDSEAVIELADTAADGSEIWHVITRYDIDRILDAQPGIISYEVSDAESPQYVAYIQK